MRLGPLSLLVFGTVVVAGCQSFLDLDENDASRPAGGEKFACKASSPGAILSCALGTERCCFGKDSSASCVAAGTSCPSGSVPTDCNKSSDCGEGNVCCGMHDSSSSFFASVRCLRPDQCAAPNARTCTDALDCPPQTTCRTYGAVMRVCRP